MWWYSCNDWVLFLLEWPALFLETSPSTRVNTSAVNNLTFPFILSIFCQQSYNRPYLQIGRLANFAPTTTKTPHQVVYVLGIAWKLATLARRKWNHMVCEPWGGGTAVWWDCNWQWWNMKCRSNLSWLLPPEENTARIHKISKYSSCLKLASAEDVSWPGTPPGASFRNWQCCSSTSSCWQLARCAIYLLLQRNGRAKKTVFTKNLFLQASFCLFQVLATTHRCYQQLVVKQVHVDSA